MANTLEQETALQYCCGVAFGELVWPLGLRSTTRLVCCGRLGSKRVNTACRKEAD